MLTYVFWFIIAVIQVYVPTTKAEEDKVEPFYEDLQDLIELTPKKKKNCPFYHRRLECKNRKSRDTGVTGKFGLRVQNEAGQRLTEFCQENALVIAKTLFQQFTRDNSTHGHHQTVNTKIRLITFFAAEVGAALSSSENKTGRWLRLRSWTPFHKIHT